MITDDDKIRGSDDKIRDDDDKMRADDSMMIAAYDKMRADVAMMRADDAMMRVKKVNFLWRHMTKKRDFVCRRGFSISVAVKKSTFFDVMWRKNVTSYVVGGSVFPKRLSTENILQPTRSLYDVWLLDLDLRPFKVIIYVWGQHRPISVYKKNIEHFLWLSFCDMTVP